MKDLSHIFFYEDGRKYRLEFLKQRAQGFQIAKVVNHEFPEHSYLPPQKLTKRMFRKVNKEFEELLA